MSQDIPQIAFKTNHNGLKEIEIITIESLMERKETLDHFPEKAHQVRFYLLIYYTEGITEHLVDFVWHSIRKNTLLYLTKGQINAFKFTPDVKGYIVLFTENYFKNQLSTLPRNTVIRLFTSHLFSPIIQVPESSQVPDYFQLFYKEFYKEKHAFNKENIINALYTIIFSKLEQLKQSQTFHIQESDKLATFLKFKSLIEHQYSKSRNADFYASEMNISYKHLNTICKEIVHKTAKQFIDEFIILEAKRQLINSSIKSTELAYALGFEEPTNFVKYFKKHATVTPNEFKNLHK
ncbi:helix-turn-helix domain-containing protein [uncultured Dokdonia sp.]|uniref:AraC family transcriptional regulator n=1 Tax=uncultured Dokdonia sp. TaxID=575653 RepID=UPI00262D72CF|nr:helix-turn-helix domain-containing protein [uncultured Dokdonia sp.]